MKDFCSGVARRFIGTRPSSKTKAEIDLLRPHGACVRFFILGVFQFIDSVPKQFASVFYKNARAMPAPSALEKRLWRF